MTRNLQQTRVLEFVTYVYANQQIQTFGMQPRCIVNIDETNNNFDLYGSLTLEKCGARTIGMKTSGTSVCCTVILGVTLSGDKLPPFIVFKGTSDARISRQLAINPPNEFPVSVKHSCQAGAWVDQTVFLNWIEQVWKPWTQGFLGEPTYLLMDDFSVHKICKCVDAIKSCGTEVDQYITPGYTSQLRSSTGCGRQQAIQRLCAGCMGEFYDSKHRK